MISTYRYTNLGLNLYMRFLRAFSAFNLWPGCEHIYSRTTQLRNEHRRIL